MRIVCGLLFVESIFRRKRFVAVSPVRRFFDETQEIFVDKKNRLCRLRIKQFSSQQMTNKRIVCGRLFVVHKLVSLKRIFSSKNLFHKQNLASLRLKSLPAIHYSRITTEHRRNYGKQMKHEQCVDCNSSNLFFVASVSWLFRR